MNILVGVALNLLLVVAAQAHASDWAASLDPLTDAEFHANGNPGEKKVALGKLLFFDKILSGNQNISCASCHQPVLHTTDGLSLPIGEGGRGVGTERVAGRVYERAPRNTMALFNLGAKVFTHMFHDGRVEVDASYASGFRSPAEEQLPPGLDNVLAAQAMFPVAAATEMAGQSWENSIALAAMEKRFAGTDGVWEQLIQRLRTIPEYVDLFVGAFDEVESATDMQFTQVANALAAFQAVAFRADNSPFDQYLRGDIRAMEPAALRGAQLFYGEANCSACHAGVLQTDQRFRAIGMPQIGPGMGDGLFGREDFGRERETGDRQDRYRFRTPSLRNAMLTGPWGHSGAYTSLRRVIAHHLTPARALENYRTSQAILPPRRDLERVDFVIHSDRGSRQRLAEAVELPPIVVNSEQIDSILAFLEALSDPAEVEPPTRVPSGLPLAD